MHFTLTLKIHSSKVFSFYSNTGRYNKPIVSQIAAVMPDGGTGEYESSNRDIILYCQDNPNIPDRDTDKYQNLQHINEMHGSFDTLAYPIISSDAMFTWRPRLYKYGALSKPSDESSDESMNEEVKTSKFLLEIYYVLCLLGV